jgi:CDK-activating kinase assembly factor MAT1
MSKPLRNGVTPRRPGEEDGEPLRLVAEATWEYLLITSEPFSTDFCPVCKSSRYLNPDLRFLVNPECYHKMCTSCVDRIFSSGPAPCPVAGCARTLRKQRFRQQTFDDINIEREVDIRRRVAQV